MLSMDDAIQFLLECARNPKPGNDGYGHYGYELYLPNVIHAYRKNVLSDQSGGFLGQGSKAEALSPMFYEAGWELCRRGIFRPGIRLLGAQATDDGASGNGYAVTAAGRAWLEQANEGAFLPVESSRYSQIIARFRDRLGDGYFQRAQEAFLCHSATAYLASCAMSGAAAESILLRLAITKKGDEAGVLKVYRSANGRRSVENMVVGKLRDPLATEFRTYMDLLKYWRDQASHGGVSNIWEFEAYEAMTRLMRLAHFADEHWDELTSSGS